MSQTSAYKVYYISRKLHRMLSQIMFLCNCVINQDHVQKNVSYFVDLIDEDYMFYF